MKKFARLFYRDSAHNTNTQSSNNKGNLLKVHDEQLILVDRDTLIYDDIATTLHSSQFRPFIFTTSKFLDLIKLLVSPQESLGSLSLNSIILTGSHTSTEVPEMLGIKLAELAREKFNDFIKTVNFFEQCHIRIAAVELCNHANSSQLTIGENGMISYHNNEDLFELKNLLYLFATPSPAIN